MTQQAGDPLIGRVLSGRFEIIAPIGVGGMGRVYKAIQRPLDRVVALKVLNPRYDQARDPGFEKRFFLEASMTAKLKHPNTITVHDYGRTDDGVYFLAMEYLEGQTLAQVLATDGALPWPRALVICGQVARSLREAHKLGLVHRDLKPANIMLLSEGTSGDVVKVLDFGLVKSFLGDGPRRDDGAELTRAGVLLGSPMYMAPEQARNEIDQRSDIYALGVVLYQTIAGRPPFVGKESIDVIVKHVREKPKPLNELVPELPVEVNSLVMKCLEKIPEARFQSMDELLEAMRVASSGQGLSGVFADPRTMSSTAMPRPSQANYVGSVTPGEVRVSSHSPPPVPTPALPSQSIPVDFTGTQAPASRAPLMVAGAMVVLGVAVGGVIAFQTLGGKGTPAAQPPAPVVGTKPLVVPPSVKDPPQADPAPPTPTVTKVVFEVTSEPPGATVAREGGAVVGITPFTFSVDRLGDEPAQAELEFSLDGYRDLVIQAQGLSGHVPVKGLLQRKDLPQPPQVRAVPAQPPRKRPPQPKPDAPPAGYKDDPYQ